MDVFKSIAKWIAKAMFIIVAIAVISETYMFFVYNAVIDSIGVGYSQIISKYGYLPQDAETKLRNQLNNLNIDYHGRSGTVRFNRIQNVQIQVLVDTGGGQITQTRRTEPANDAEYEVQATASPNGIMTRKDNFTLRVSYDYHFCLPDLPFGFTARTMNPGIPKTMDYPSTCVRLIKQQSF